MLASVTLPPNEPVRVDFRSQLVTRVERFCLAQPLVTTEQLESIWATKIDVLPSEPEQLLQVVPFSMLCHGEVNIVLPVLKPGVNTLSIELLNKSDAPIVLSFRLEGTEAQ